MKSLSFSLRLIIPIILLLMGCIAGGFSYVRQVSLAHQRVASELTQRAKLTALTTTQLFEYLYRRTDIQHSQFEGITLVISRLSGDPNLNIALFCDEQNSIRSANQYELQNKPLKTVVSDDIATIVEKVRSNRLGEVIVNKDQSIVTAIYPVVFPPQSNEIRSDSVGAVILEYNLSKAEQLAIADASKQSLQMVMIIALLCVLVGILLDQIITKRAAKLVHASNEFAKGNYQTRIPVSGSDELAQISNAFNRMAMLIQEDTEALQSSEKRLILQTEALENTLQELNQTQVQLVQQEKMSSLGQLVAGIAHEINNPVNFIFANLIHLEEYSQNLLDLVECYQEHYPEPEPKIEDKIEEMDLEFLQEDLVKILKSMRIGADRICKIVLSLRNFSRLDEAEVKEVDLHEGIESTLMILQHRIKKQGHRPEIKIIREYGDLPCVECYIGQLNQVLMNILVNAIDALEERLNNQSDQDQEQDEHPLQITIRTSLLENQWVEIAIADNAFGIPEEIKDKIFNPFFTTKSIGKGTGMGMSISYQIITEKHHGKLDCISTLGKGTEFRIQIPVRQSEYQEITPIPAA